MSRKIIMNEEQIISDLTDIYGTEVTSGDIRGYCAINGVSYQTITKRLEKYKTGHGKWNLEVTTEAIESIENSYNASPASPMYTENLIPDKDVNFVSFGNFRDIKKIISSGIFYPTFITGLSGNGKTMAVEQACAQLKREMIRVNLTIETDADELIGGFRISSGNMYWHNGPVVEAMERGAILLLDECLDENEEILVGTVDNNNPIKLVDMEYNTEYPIVSFNMDTGELENDNGYIVSDKDDVIYEVELENGKKIRLNSKHPFIVIDENGKFSEKTIDGGLQEGDYVTLAGMKIEQQKIKTITKIGTGRVRNLTVNKNHTFITSNGIVTHNCDLASNKIMVLQSVMEGKPLFLKKISKLIHPKAGFNIIATANTKGKGSDDGRFIGTSVMNEAFLERFSVTFEQAYPSPAIETKILTKIAKLLNVDDDDFIKKLVDWGDSIRKTFYDGGVDEIISTRRLVHIIKAYAIFGNKSKAIKIATNRFDDCVKTAFLNLYNTLDEHFNLDSSGEEEGVDETESV
jgi:hypothetical protein